MYNVVFMSSLINLKNAAIKICSWHVHLFACQFLHDSGGVSMFLWQWMFLSFLFYVFNLHWRVCSSKVKNTWYEHQNISMLLFIMNYSSILRPIVLLLLFWNRYWWIRSLHIGIGLKKNWMISVLASDMMSIK